MVLYPDLFSLIKHKPFRLSNVPMWYTAKTVEVRDSFKKIVEPFFSPELNEVCAWRAPIIYIVDMFVNDVPFMFVYKKDMLEVHDHLKYYLDWAASLDVIPFDHAVFYENTKKFFPWLKNRCIRILKAKGMNTASLDSTPKTQPFGELLVKNVIAPKPTTVTTLTRLM